MAKRVFHVEFSGTLELDDSVIDAVDDDWRAELYPLHSVEEIAEHIAYNLARGCELTQLDGWADQSNDKAKLSDFACDSAWEAPVAKPKKQAAKRRKRA